MNKKTSTKVPASRQEIAAKIKEAMIKEELAVPVYTSHIEQTFFWSGLPLAKQKKVIAGLRILAKDSRRHAKIFERIANDYK